MSILYLRCSFFVNRSETKYEIEMNESHDDYTPVVVLSRVKILNNQKQRNEIGRQKEHWKEYLEWKSRSSTFESKGYSDSRTRIPCEGGGVAGNDSCYERAFL